MRMAAEAQLLAAMELVSSVTCHQASRFRHRDDIKGFLLGWILLWTLKWTDIVNVSSHRVQACHFWALEIWKVFPGMKQASWSCESYLTYLYGSLISAIRARIMPIRTKQDFSKTYLCLQKTSEFESTLLMLPWSRKMNSLWRHTASSWEWSDLVQKFSEYKNSHPHPLVDLGNF